LTDFSPDYLRCLRCETLVLASMPDPQTLSVTNDTTDFYGRGYYESHLIEDYGYPDLMARVRSDLPERALHWLQTLLKYKLPPGQALELGSAHGGFVALLQQAGFDATGLELSEWVVDFARKTFKVPMLLGPIEEQQIELGTLDVVALMDVLEHLPDPVGTMRRCLELLKPDGILVIQTPCYPLGTTYDTMLAISSPFLEQLKRNEHLYLYSQAAVRKLFGDLHAEHLVFEPAIFGHYDMFFVVSRQPLVTNSTQAIEEILSQSVSGRMIQALIDKASEVDQLRSQVAHAAGLEADVAYLKGQIATTEASQVAQLEQLNAQLAASEADRAARLQIIEQQAAATEQVVAEIEARLAASETDRSARLAVIERQGSELGRIPALEADIEYLKGRLISSENERAAQATVIEQLMEKSRRLEKIRELFGAHTPSNYIRMLSPARWRKIWNVLQPPSSAARANDQIAAPDAQPAHAGSYELDAYVAEIHQFNSAQSNAALLDRIRAYNHSMIETFDRLRPFTGKRLLDIGASPHGYALERAMALGLAEYVGIGLDVEQPVEVRSATSCGKLLYMNAERLELPEESFDLVISLSTFEHVGDVASVLAEITRVLKPGGSALITFEPIWTCSYGHHLHHFGPVAAHMPDWAHLLWDKQQMRAELASVWPADGAISLDDAAAWTFDSSAINRISITQMREYFQQSGLEIEWMVPIPDEKRDPERLKAVAAATSFSAADLMAKGLSVLLNKAENKP
jgi:2-polyprenyl-3-methyl-5-hydroxy-6-metoxy-1,4-benzoquinol methylase